MRVAGQRSHFIDSRPGTGPSVLAVVALGLLASACGGRGAAKAVGPGASGLSAPVQVGPPDGSVFDTGGFPRITTLSWKSVGGASGYRVEVDCFHCCVDGEWCTDVGRTWDVTPPLAGTRYLHSFVGAQPGRWRVWAVDSSGHEGAKSVWWTFRYVK